MSSCIKPLRWGFIGAGSICDLVASQARVMNSAELEAVRAGKHVLCEKPLGLNADEVRQVIVAAGDRTVAEGFMIRHHGVTWVSNVAGTAVLQ